MRLAPLFFAAALSCLCTVADAQTVPRDSLVVARTEVGYQLSVPVSRLVMTIADTKIERKIASGGSTSNPRYFIFSDDHRRLIVSGWFEPAHLFKGVAEHWSSQTESWRKQGLVEPLNVEEFSLDGWQIVCYDIEIPGVTNTHVRAHWVQAGTWIDMHISLTGKLSQGILREAIFEFLKKVTFVERSDG